MARKELPDEEHGVQGGPVERVFTGVTPEEKVQEVIRFVGELGLLEHEALIRMFDGERAALMMTKGTDRAGLNSADTRRVRGPHDEHYTKLLGELGLGQEDGMYAIPFPDWYPKFTQDIFRSPILHAPVDRIAVAVYHGDFLNEIETRVSASEYSQMPPALWGLGEFFYFKNPGNKRQALKGIITQRPGK